VFNTDSLFFFAKKLRSIKKNRTADFDLDPVFNGIRKLNAVDWLLEKQQ